MTSLTLLIPAVVSSLHGLLDSYENFDNKLRGTLPLNQLLVFEQLFLFLIFSLIASVDFFEKSVTLCKLSREFCLIISNRYFRSVPEQRKFTTRCYREKKETFKKNFPFKPG